MSKVTDSLSSMTFGTVAVPIVASTGGVTFGTNVSDSGTRSQAVSTVFKPPHMIHEYIPGQRVMQCPKFDSPAFESLPVLTDQQLDAAETIIKGDHRVMALTGRAGSGKSTVVKYISALRPELVTLSSTTGRSALLINGITLDRLFCFIRGRSRQASKNGDEEIPWEVRFGASLDGSMRDSNPLLIVDEASMVGANMARCIQDVLDAYPAKRILLVGDWAQASPVDDFWPFNSDLFAGLYLIRLTECHRQKAGEYLDCLNDIRAGEETERACRLFRSREAPPTHDPNNIRMYATNALADEYNTDRFNELLVSFDTKPPVARVYANFQDERPMNVSAQYPFSEARIRGFKADSGFADDVRLCKGTRVLVTRNGRGWGRSRPLYVNGDLGTVEAVFEIEDEQKRQIMQLWASTHQGEEMSQDEFMDRFGGVSVKVRLDRTSEIVVINPDFCEIRASATRKQATVFGLPLRYGWAVTIHKLQGITVDKAWVDMQSILRMPPKARHGLAYVALSRTRTLEGLTLSGFQESQVYCSPAVQHYI